MTLQMREGRLRKVVLARNYLVHFDVDVEPLDLLLQLQVIQKMLGRRV
jgi:isochorismate synthase EntC